MMKFLSCTVMQNLNESVEEMFKKYKMLCVSQDVFKFKRKSTSETLDVAHVKFM